MINHKRENLLIYVPLVAFILYAWAYGMTDQAWLGAFELGGLLALIVTGMQLKEGVILDRIMLGLNVFLIVGAIGFLFDVGAILEWYSVSRGGPLFGSIAMVGLIATLFTKAGFIGVIKRDKQAQKYASFLLLAATFVAFIWAVNGDDRGIFWAVVVPFILLRLTREQLIQHVL